MARAYICSKCGGTGRGNAEAEFSLEPGYKGTKIHLCEGCKDDLKEWLEAWSEN